MGELEPSGGEDELLDCTEDDIRMDYHFQRFAVNTVNFFLEAPSKLRTIDIIGAITSKLPSFPKETISSTPIHDEFSTGDYASHIKFDYKTWKREARLAQYNRYRGILELEKIAESTAERFNERKREHEELRIEEEERRKPRIKKSEGRQVMKEMWVFGLCGSGIGFVTADTVEKFVYPLLRPVKAHLLLVIPAFFGYIAAELYMKNLNTIRPILRGFHLIPQENKPSVSASNSQPEETEEIIETSTTQKSLNNTKQIAADTPKTTTTEDDPKKD